jgi:hypothetical protein
MKQLPKLSQRNLELIQRSNEISIYKDNLLTSCIVKNIAKIKSAFPSLPKGFYEIFSERITEDNFTSDRLTDAVNFVIDNCTYPTPTVAQFISFDKRVKVYKYPEIVEMVETGIDSNAFARYKRIELEG